MNLSFSKYGWGIVCWRRKQDQPTKYKRLHSVHANIFEKTWIDLLSYSLCVEQIRLYLYEATRSGEWMYEFKARYEFTVITEANTIVGLYLYSVFTNPMFLSTNSLSIVYTFSWEYISFSTHIVICPLFNITSVH